MTLKEYFLLGSIKEFVSCLHPIRNFIFFLVLKSDNANGVFGFLSSNCQSRVNENDTSIAFEVSRAFGTFGAVRINWEIRRNDSSRILASNDFHAATGSFSFSQGQTKKVCCDQPLLSILDLITCY